MKNTPRSGRSSRRGNQPAPYTKYQKTPHRYPGESRLANGDLHTKANASTRNKYP